jgi:hypothetical protein
MEQIIVKIPFDGYCQDFLRNGLTSVYGLTWQQYQQDFKARNKEGRLELVSNEFFEAMLERQAFNRYLSKPAEAISEAIYMEKLEILPPENWTQDGTITHFRMCEYETGTITAQYAKQHDQYRRKYIDVCDRSTWISAGDFK